MIQRKGRISTKSLNTPIIEVKETIPSLPAPPGSNTPPTSTSAFHLGMIDSPGLSVHLPLLLNRIPRISLEEMNGISLMNRMDRKFVVAASDIPDIISDMQMDYYVQETGGKRITTYSTTYLDTKDLRLYLDHANGKLNRFKWRTRSYDNSAISFLEIKRKSNKGRTKKTRIEFSPFHNLQEGVASDFILAESGMDATTLSPSLSNRFERITFTNFGKTERATVDFNIFFSNCLNGRTAAISNLCIIEIKQDKFIPSLLYKKLSDRRIRTLGISKYCLGMALTAENLKINFYKSKIRSIHKITSKL